MAAHCSIAVSLFTFRLLAFLRQTEDVRACVRNYF